MFSSRVPDHRSVNRLATAISTHRAAGRPLLDLTITNPTRCGIVYPEDVLAPLADSLGRDYAPEPFGLRAAREAVARDYARRGIGVASAGVDAARIVLTASTSEAYSLLFKLLCEPAGDDVLVPSPSYPLFDHLTRLDGIRCTAYPLDYHGRWELDFDALDAAWTPRTRAVLAVSPNNPTGSTLSPDERAGLDTRCAAREAAVILDEVFADYPLRGQVQKDEVTTASALTFRLGGLSKSAGLPQVKLGWILVDGPESFVHEALDRLELICDTYLSVSTPVQVAASALIDAGAALRAQILQRIRANHATLSVAAARHPAVSLLHADGGWSAVLRVPGHRPEEEITQSLLEECDTLVHPGFFFDFRYEAFLIVSLLPEEAVFAEGTRRLLEHLDD